MPGGELLPRLPEHVAGRQGHVGEPVAGPVQRPGRVLLRTRLGSERGDGVSWRVVLPRRERRRHPVPRGLVLPGGGRLVYYLPLGRVLSGGGCRALSVPARHVQPQRGKRPPIRLLPVCDGSVKADRPADDYDERIMPGKKITIN